ncbi:MAG: class I SAM-dependent DNA methyltransferase, partial [Bacteroidales bacterium]|nr:class I SAM-dependent DNA methyltransferase [Bacteroidales bacterium]
ETIRKAVIQKFNEFKGWTCQNLDELYDKIENIKEANDIINQLKICDPAVGSGHFLVSALNEIIAIKNDLRLLQDKEGKRLKEYSVEVLNDELIITDEDGKFFEYNPKSKESQRIQVALFHEKQTIIENCLFGVDINPNSVKICRLRLWIELLKNAYYKGENELETLPNIDINIKCGNSLISRFALDSDLSQLSDLSIEKYQKAVQTYRNAANKAQKHEMDDLIKDIKNGFKIEISAHDPKITRFSRLNNELNNLVNQNVLFEETAKKKKARAVQQKKLEKEINQLNLDIEDLKNNKIYDNAFEWRFEFPEVLNDNGDFVGFDVIIGNPPYVRHESIKAFKPSLTVYQVYSSTSDLYTYFYELSYKLLKKEGFLAFITSNKWMRTAYGKNLRQFILDQVKILCLIDLKEKHVFEATVDTNILLFSKAKADNTHCFKTSNTIEKPAENLAQSFLSADSFVLAKAEVYALKAKIEAVGTPLKDWDISIYRGILTGFNQAFIIDTKTKEQLCANDPKSAEILKPLLRGRDIRRYSSEWAG